jgi:hypothetical protein
MKVTGALMIALALIVGIVPFFTDCQSQGRVLTLANGREIPMKCHWTGLAEIALAIPLLAMGVFLVFSKRAESMRNLSLTAVVTGVLIILLPTALIGVCGSAQMICNSVMKPTLILLGSLVIALGLVGTLRALRRKEEPV